MNGGGDNNLQQGIALVVALLFLLIITVIGVVAAVNSGYVLQMSMNTQDSLHSFQAAEAGAYAAFASAGTADDLFDGSSTDDVFGSLSDEESPLGLLETGASSVTTNVILTSSATACPRKIHGFSVGLLDCDYYRIESQHLLARRARTEVNMGVVKTIIGGGVR